MTREEVIEYWEQFNAEIDDLYDACSDADRDVFVKQREIVEYTISALRKQEPNDWICTLKCTALMDEGMCSHGGLCCLYESQRTIKENQPLTMDELRKMDGEPVWTVTTGVSSSGRWELCTCETVCACPLHKELRFVTADGEVTDYDLDTYGKTWLAYRQRQEEDDHG